MTYRTRTYIAGDWTGDSQAINILYSWNESDYWSLSFTNAHDLMSARDSSLNCTIKNSLKQRMNASKRFVLIVGKHTKTLTAGGCQLCDSYNPWNKCCTRSPYYCVDYRSFIRFECEEAVKAGIEIVVLYNSVCVDKNKCPESVRDAFYHIPMKYVGRDGNTYWDYQRVKAVLE